jgi:hypothetical protein
MQYMQYIGLICIHYIYQMMLDNVAFSLNNVNKLLGLDKKSKAVNSRCRFLNFNF